MSAAVILINVCIAVAAVIACLYTIAARLGFDVELHRLKLETRLLRLEYSRRTEALRNADLETTIEIGPFEAVHEPDDSAARAA